MKRVCHITEISLLALLLICLVVSCANKDDYSYQKVEIKSSDFFNYSTVTSNKLSLNLNMTNTSSIFYIYDENPYEEVNGQQQIKNINPIYAGETDNKGVFTALITIPSYLTKVWLVVGLSNPVELNVNNDGITYDSYQSAYTAVKTRGTTTAGYSYPDGWGVLGEWDETGIIGYGQSGLTTISLPLITAVKSIFLGNNEKHVLRRYPEFVNLGSQDLALTKASNMIVSFLSNGNASINSTLGYFTYKTGDTPDLSKVKPTIIFPNTETSNMGNSNGKVQLTLKYWNGTEYQSEFPASTSICWFIMTGGFVNGNVDYRTQFSNKFFTSDFSLNDDHVQHSVVLLDKSDEDYATFIIAMEDQKSTIADFDYRDAIFTVQVDKSSIIPDNYYSLPEITNEKEISYSTKGSLAYEDNWPRKGDYDMNDLVLNYNCSRIKGAGLNTWDNDYKAGFEGKVKRIIDSFTPVNNGATYTNGFGYELTNISSNDVSKITVYIDGVEKTDFSWDKTLAHPILYLFDDIKQALNKEYKVVTEFNKGIDEANVSAPYNPFIFVNNRSHEVHLTSCTPTVNAYDPLRGTYDDLRQDSQGKAMYYVSSDNMPFAINLSGVYFAWPTETQSITVAYPKFSVWSKNFGTSNKDWYVR